MREWRVASLREGRRRVAWLRWVKNSLQGRSRTQPLSAPSLPPPRSGVVRTHDTLGFGLIGYSRPHPPYHPNVKGYLTSRRHPPSHSARSTARTSLRPRPSLRVAGQTAPPPGTYATTTRFWAWTLLTRLLRGRGAGSSGRATPLPAQGGRSGVSNSRSTRRSCWRVCLRASLDGEGYIRPRVRRRQELRGHWM